MTSTETLIESLNQGHQGAFAELYRKLQPEMLRYATGLLAGDRAAAEDAVDEAFTAVWQHADRYAGTGNADGWVRRIVRNKAIDALRKNRGMRGSDALADDSKAAFWTDEPSPFDHAAAADQAKWLRSALGQLNSDQRGAVWMCYYEDKSLAEIATIMGCPENTVKTRLFHARKTLRATLYLEDA